MVDYAAGADVGRSASHSLYNDVRTVASARCVVAQGAQVMTLDGALPVEFLTPGDRVVTCGGARRLVSVEVAMHAGEMVQIQPGALGHERPEQALLLAPETRVFLRDWRAEALYGAKTALVPVHRLVDGEYVTRVSVAQARLFVLGFEREEVIYVDGVQLATDPARIGAKV